MTRAIREGDRGGVAVAFMGLDGTGKSTQAEALEAQVAARGGRPVRVHHASTKVPGLRDLKQRYHGAAVRILRHRRARSARRERGTRAPGGGGAVGWILSVYLLAGSLLKSGWYRWRYRKETLILDRCVLDDVVKVRWRLGVQTRLSGVLIRLAPKPKVVVVLQGDPAQTFQRKKAANCTYEEYLEKRRFLELTLQEAVDLGWVVEQIRIDGRTRDEVFQEVSRVLEAYGRVLGAWAPKGTSSSERSQ